MSLPPSLICLCLQSEQVLYQGCWYCGKCFKDAGIPVFEHDVEQPRNIISSKRNFERLMVESQLPGIVRVAMVDLFPRMENHMAVTGRRNFINLEQLARSMLQVLGYGQYVHLFKPLKMAKSVVMVDTFVQDALGVAREGTGIKLEDMPMLMPVAGEMDLHKRNGDEACNIYSDKFKYK